MTLKNMENYIKKFKNIKSFNSLFSHLQSSMPYFLRKCLFNYLNFVSFNYDEEEIINKKNFKNYLLDKDVRKEYFDLIKNLDEKSINVVNTVLGRLLNNSPMLFKKNFTKAEIEGMNLYYKMNKNLSKNLFNEMKFKKIFLPGFRNYAGSVFDFHHGLRLFEKEKINEYLRGGDCIDGGAFDLDSTITFISNYNLKYIYSFEVDLKNFKRCNKNLKQFYKSFSNIKIINKGLSNQNDHIYFESTGTAGSSININQSKIHKKNSNKVELVTIDNFSFENNLNIKLIKLDIEGSELEALKGATNTIVRNLPILTVCIYHNLNEFFNIKPFIESIAPNQYNFYIRKLAPFFSPIESCLIAIPKSSGIKIKESDVNEIYG